MFPCLSTLGGGVMPFIHTSLLSKQKAAAPMLPTKPATGAKTGGKGKGGKY